ncbi:diacylglycerol kinase theta isoform X6 [Lutzomyia longipalpis]|uniref:diacylglycerol kinase theta isoform X6 n=1 Tax=Lutzomyia longipalpis TaxID=7200 RepID=UPI0024840054|nr:diacylglycerol kinase theta isoform X6 [Lutzomyia longipalpis]
MADGGHSFGKKTFHKPTYCHHCSDLLWGLIGQGYICEVCNFIVHERCVTNVVTPCSGIAPSIIKNPVAHCWSEPTHHKRRFCTVCRKRLDETPAVHCMICEYFAHVECQDFAVADCKENATYVPGKDLASVKHQHHWREGNLPQTSKCYHCKKSCFSSECLTGYRCEWCGATCHGGCRSLVNPECKFGVLEPIYLPPHAVSIPRTEVPMEAIIGVQVKSRSTPLQRDYSCPRSISEEFSSGDAARFRDEEYTSKPEGACASGSHPRAESAHKSDKDKERRDKEKEDKDEETIKVFDGNSSLRRRIFRAITVSRTCTLDQLLTTALRAFHIARNPSEFFLTDLYAQGGEEVRVQDPHPVLTLTRIEGKRPAIFLRFRDNENDKGFVRVYPGKLQLDDIEESFVAVPVDNDTTVRDLIRDALNLFALEGRNVDEYRCLEVLLDRGVTERILCNNERPWEIMKQLGRDSIRQMELMRFYLQHKQDPHGPNLALFVGNLPPGLSQRNYEHMLNKYVSEDKFTSIGPIYYEYGSVVITYEDASKAVRAFYTLREAICEGKNLLVLLLPNIEPSMVRPETFPLLVFVNVKSGGCQGLELISSFRKLLNPYQVFDLDNGGPLPGLYVFRHIKTYKILVCGGDGTIGWVLQCLDNVGQDSECSSPPCAIVPLGTGNDLARVLRWGPGYTGGEDPLNLLRDVIEAEEIRLDRWTVVFHPEDKPEDVAPKAPSNSTGKKKKKVRTAQPSQQNQQLHLAAIANQGGGAQSEDNSQIFVMNNYFGIGIDADLCLDFHNAREENPNKFNSRLHNKGVYVKMGLRKMVGRKIVKELHKEIRLEVDGKVVELPQVEGIIILNILSWGSGANPWGPEKEDQFSKPNHWDGMLEIVGVTGVVHLGQIQSGLRSAIRIAQGGHIKIHMYSEIPVQVDGEPWVQSPGDVVVLKSALKATMLKKCKGKMKRRNTEPTMALGPSTPAMSLAVAPQDNDDNNETDF